jgi:hypothetical protein
MFGLKGLSDADYQKKYGSLNLKKRLDEQSGKTLSGLKSPTDIFPFFCG